MLPRLAQNASLFLLFNPFALCKQTDAQRTAWRTLASTPYTVKLKMRLPVLKQTPKTKIAGLTEVVLSFQLPPPLLPPVYTRSPKCIRDPPLPPAPSSSLSSSSSSPCACPFATSPGPCTPSSSSLAPTTSSSSLPER